LSIKACIRFTSAIALQINARSLGGSGHWFRLGRLGHKAVRAVEALRDVAGLLALFKALHEDILAFTDVTGAFLFVLATVVVVFVRAFVSVWFAVSTLWRFGAHFVLLLAVFVRFTLGPLWLGPAGLGDIVGGRGLGDIVGGRGRRRSA